MKFVKWSFFFLAMSYGVVSAQNVLFLPFQHNTLGLEETLKEKGISAISRMGEAVEVQAAYASFSYQFHQDQLYGITMEKVYQDKRTSKEIYQAWMRFFYYKQATLLETLADQRDYRHFIYVAENEVYEFIVKQTEEGDMHFSLTAKFVPHMPYAAWGPHEAMAYQRDIEIESLLAAEEIIHAGMRYYK